MYFSFQQWLWNAFVYWFDDMRLAFKINAWSNEFGSDLTHPKYECPIGEQIPTFCFLFFFSLEIHAKLHVKMSVKIECWENSAPIEYTTEGAKGMEYSETRTQI